MARTRKRAPEDEAYDASNHNDGPKSPGARPDRRTKALRLVGAAFVIIACAIVGSAGLHYYQVQSRVYSQQEFIRATAGLSQRELRSLLGSPDQVETPLYQIDTDRGNEGYWMYKERTRDPNTSKVDPVVYVWIYRGRVSHVTW